jgi:hypothetical protein
LGWATLAALRGANLGLGAAALLVFMVWTWRLLGLAEALLAGTFLALDPAFFFLAALDWGSLLPSLLCRCGGFLLALLAWRRQQARWALVAGVVLGLGCFNKIDFGVILAGTGLAAAYAYGPALMAAGKARPKVMLAGLLGFLVGAGPVLAQFRVILRAVCSPNAPHNPGEFAEKWHTLGAMYDGSYFYRLMEAGGLFDKMYLTRSPVWTPFGWAVILAAAVLVAEVCRRRGDDPTRRTKVFILAAGGLVTLGALLLPGAVRIHHTTMVYPFPHLILAAACMAAWRGARKAGGPGLALKLAAAGAVLLVAAGNLAAVQRTETLIHQTGGSGWWSNSLTRFAEQLKGRGDLTVSCLDWGFNEQLEFLDGGPQLEEPFWLAAMGGQPSLPRDDRHVYLVHAPAYSLSPWGGQFMTSVLRENTNAVVTPWRDGQGTVVFYAVTFAK